MIGGSPPGASATAMKEAPREARATPRVWLAPPRVSSSAEGPTFRAEQRSDPRLATIPVVLLTADVRIEEKRQQLGAVDLIPKPVQLEDLLDVVRRQC